LAGKSTASHSGKTLIPCVPAHGKLYPSVTYFRAYETAEADGWKSVLILYFTENPVFINTLNATGVRKIE
jgi:hypothetical protein